MNIDFLEDLFTNTPIEWLKSSDIKPEILQEGHVKVALPAEKHFNHVKTVYAGSIFMLAELTAGALFFSVYGNKEFAPVVRDAKIVYSKPATSDIYAEAKLSKEEAEALIAPVREKGRGNIFIEMPVFNKDSEECARAVLHIYCLPLK